MSDPAWPVIPAPRRLHSVGRTRPLRPEGLALAAPSSLLDVLAAISASTGGPPLRPSSALDADVVVELAPGLRPGAEDPPIGLDPGISPEGSAEDEAYEITSHGGALVVRAADERGAFRGLVSVLQATRRQGPGWELPLVDVVDWPLLRWRGLSLDVARRFLDPTVLRAVVDLAAYHHLNVLHLHLTDHQAWRVVMPGRSELTCGDDAYTPDQLRDLAEYAARRHVTLVPEIDMPGHVGAAVRAYPELMGDHALVHPGLAHLRPDVPEAMRFAREAVDLLCSLAPGPYVHLGADEAFGMDSAHYASFVRIAHGWVSDAGKVPVAWQEAIRSGGFADGGVVQYWVAPGDMPAEQDLDNVLPPEYQHFKDALVEMFAAAPGDLDRVVRQNAWVLLSPSMPFYLDRRYGEGSVDSGQGDLMDRLGHAGYRPQRTSELYAWQLEDVPGAADGTVRVAGAEAAVWCESVTGINDLAALLLPRLPVLAELMWTRDRTPSSLGARVSRHASAWSSLGFSGFYRSQEIFG